MRSLYRIPLTLLALAIVISLAATAQTSAPPSQSQVSSQAQTSTTPPQPQTSHEGQTSAPPSQAAPQGQTGSSTSAQPNQAQGQASIEDELQLTPDQKQKIAAIVDDENKQIVAVRDDSSLSMDQKVQKARAIRQAGAPKIKAVLTPEQVQKLSAIQERARQQQQQQQNSPAPPPQPQH